MLVLVIPLLGALIVLNAAPSGKTHTVVIKDFQFVPERLVVEPGDTVIWENQDIVPHTATARKTFDSKQIDPGSSWSYIVKQKGNLSYICTFHPTMKAELVVKHNEQQRKKQNAGSETTRQ